MATPADVQMLLTSNRDLLQKVAMGLVKGMSFIAKFGENTDIDGAFEDIWEGGGTYVAPTTSRLHNIASTDGEDTGVILSSGTATGGSSNTLIDTTATFSSDGVAAGDFVINDDQCILGRVISTTEKTITLVRMAQPSNGLQFEDYSDDLLANVSGDEYRVVTYGTGSPRSTGAAILWVVGLGADYTLQEEFIVMNGTTPVSTTKTFTRIHRARVFLSSLAGAIGTISATAVVDGTVSIIVTDGNNQSLHAIFTIPSDKVGFIVDWWGALSKKQAATSVIRIRAGEINNINYITENRVISSTGTTQFVRDFPFWLTFPGGSDVHIEADASTTDVGVSAGFDILLVDLDLYTAMRRLSV